MAGDRLVVIVTIESGEPFAGSVSAALGEPELVFHGWIGFVEAIETLRRRSDGRNMGRSPDGTAGTGP